MPLHRQQEIDVKRCFKPTGNQRQVSLFDSMLAEGPAESFPVDFVGGENQRTGRLHIEAMHNARSQPAFPYTENLGNPRNHRVQDGVALIGSQGVNPATGRLVDDEPSRAFRHYLEGEILARKRPLVRSEKWPVDLEGFGQTGRARLVRYAEATPGKPDPSNLEQMPHPGSRDGQLIGEKAIESPSDLFPLDLHSRRLHLPPLDHDYLRDPWHDFRLKFRHEWHESRSVRRQD